MASRAAAPNTFNMLPMPGNMRDIIIVLWLLYHVLHENARLKQTIGRYRAPAGR